MPGKSVKKKVVRRARKSIIHSRHELLNALLHKYRHSVLGVLVMLIVIVGLVLFQHPTLFLGQISQISSDQMTAFPQDMFVNFYGEFREGVFVAQNVSHSDLRDLFRDIRSPLFSVVSSDRYEDVFIANDRIWVLKADAIASQSQYYDVTVGEYFPIDRARIERIEDSEMIIPLQSVWQMYALLRNIEIGIVEFNGKIHLPIDSSEIRYEADLVAKTPFLRPEGDFGFVRYVFERSVDSKGYGKVIIRIAN